MPSKFNISKFFNREAELLIKAREECLELHGDDIRAAGNQVEIAVREWLTRMLPRTLSVNHGYVIDINSNKSPQLDCIICDNKLLPTLFTAKDGTEFIPMDSVYAIGEIKSTYYKSQKYFEKLGDDLVKMKKGLERNFIENTAFPEPKANSRLDHILHPHRNKYLNRLFSFSLFINSGDAKVEDLVDIYKNTDDERLPNIAVFLDTCIISKMSIEDQFLTMWKYPEDAPDSAKWHISLMPKHEESDATGTGKHLACLYFNLLNHIKESLLEPPDLTMYLKDLLVGSKKGLIEIEK